MDVPVDPAEGMEMRTENHIALATTTTANLSADTDENGRRECIDDQLDLIVYLMTGRDGPQAMAAARRTVEAIDGALREFANEFRDSPADENDDDDDDGDDDNDDDHDDNNDNDDDDDDDEEEDEDDDDDDDDDEDDNSENDDDDDEGHGGTYDEPQPAQGLMPSDVRYATPNMRLGEWKTGGGIPYSITLDQFAARTGFGIRENRGGGTCLYYAMSFIEYGDDTKDHAWELRQRAVAHVRQYKQAYMALGSDDQLESENNLLAQDKKCGTILHVQAFANVLNRPFIVITITFNPNPNIGVQLFEPFRTMTRAYRDRATALPSIEQTNVIVWISDSHSIHWANALPIETDEARALREAIGGQVARHYLDFFEIAQPDRVDEYMRHGGEHLSRRGVERT
jgi:hypothetical protein